MGDYGDAIKINPDYAEAYCNRAECLRKLAEIETDKDKREGYIKQAEDDEREVEKLKQKGK